MLPWLKRNLFSDWKNTLGTLIVLALLVRYLPPLLDWAVFNAVARPDNAACRAIGHEGACWGVIAEKYRLILFGRYPVRGAVAAAARDGADGRSDRRELLPQVLEALAGRRLGRGARRRSSC